MSCAPLLLSSIASEASTLDVPMTGLEAPEASCHFIPSSCFLCHSAKWRTGTNSAIASQSTRLTLSTEACIRKKPSCCSDASTFKKMRRVRGRTYRHQRFNNNLASSSQPTTEEESRTKYQLSGRRRTLLALLSVKGSRSFSTNDASLSQAYLYLYGRVVRPYTNQLKQQCSGIATAPWRNRRMICVQRHCKCRSHVLRDTTCLLDIELAF